MIGNQNFIFITLQSIGEDEYGKTGHSKIFTFLRNFNQGWEREEEEGRREDGEMT